MCRYLLSGTLLEAASHKLEAAQGSLEPSLPSSPRRSGACYLLPRGQRTTSKAMIQDHSPRKNWAGNYTYRAQKLYRPSTIEQV
jgi:hypothetical protein